MTRSLGLALLIALVPITAVQAEQSVCERIGKLVEKVTKKRDGLQARHDRTAQRALDITESKIPSLQTKVTGKQDKLNGKKTAAQEQLTSAQTNCSGDPESRDCRKVPKLEKKLQKLDAAIARLAERLIKSLDKLNSKAARLTGKLPALLEKVGAANAQLTALNEQVVQNGCSL